MSICTVEECGLQGKYDGKCALHCNKGSYESDSQLGVLSDFYNELFELISKLDLNFLNPIDRKDYIDYLRGNKFEYDNVKSTVKGTELPLFNIHFPQRKSNDKHDYIQLLKLFYGVRFNNCVFSVGLIDIESTRVFYRECIFNNIWNIKSCEMLENAEDVIYQLCTFKKEVECNSFDNEKRKLKIESQLFCDCQFEKNLHCYGASFQNSIFSNTEEFQQNICEIKIEKCLFEGRFMLNNSILDTLSLLNTEINGKVELKHNSIQNVEIRNVNFKMLFDAYRSKFKNFKVQRSIFDDFTGFEKCEFGIKDDNEKDKVEFEYVTFLSFTNFRKAKFFNGLDIEHTNLKEPPNFLNAEIFPKNTNRETYRIIKHSFEKIGNQLEANKYFSHEMAKYRDELRQNRRLSAERGVFWFNSKISNFGSSVSRPLILMVTFALLYYLAVIGFESNLLYQIYEPANPFIDGFMTQANLFAKGIPPYGRFLKEGMEFVTLIFHICFLIFTWHFIIAVKRCTKR